VPLDYHDDPYKTKHTIRAQNDYI